MDDYVSKPIHARRLFDAIEAVVDVGAENGPSEESVSEDNAPKDVPPHEAKSPGQQTVDWAEALSIVQGNRQLLRTVVDAILSELPQLMESVRRAIDTEDPDALRIAAHTLKGSLRYFGVTTVADCAFALERMGQTRNLGDMRPALAELEREVAQLVPQLENYMRENIEP